MEHHQHLTQAHHRLNQVVQVVIILAGQITATVVMIQLEVLGLDNQEEIIRMQVVGLVDQVRD